MANSRTVTTQDLCHLFGIPENALAAELIMKTGEVPTMRVTTYARVCGVLEPITQEYELRLLADKPLRED